jgi:hypothetical protein
MNKYIVRISKNIDASFVVEAETIEDAYNAEISFEKMCEVSDGGWDIVWDAELLDGDEPAYITLANMKEIAGHLLP